MSDPNYDQLLEQQRETNKLLGRLVGASGKTPVGGGTTSGSNGGGSGLLSDADSKVGKFTASLTEGAGKVSNAIGSAAGAIEGNGRTWQDLSSKGANFSNDVVGMTVAAKGSRVDLDQFADTIKDNNTAMIGLGTNVGRGSQNFASLTQEMYDNYSGTTDALRAQGMTNKELNDVLALQIGFQRGSFKDTKEGHAESIEAAAKLAEEMNKTSQLTGQSRKEQEDAMKKAQADSQVEAKMRLIGAKEGPEAEAKARAAFAEQYQQAQARGEGQYFKEVFATGHAVSQEAATQAALNGAQARATAEQAKATARGDAAAASAANQKAREEQLKNASDISFLQRSTMGAASKATYEADKARMAASQGMYDAESKIRQEAQFKNASKEEVLAEMDKRARMEQHGKTKEGADVAGKASTDAALKLTQRTNDASSAIYNGMVKPINEGAAPAIKNFTNSFLNPTVKTPTGEVMTRPQAQAKEVQAGMQAGNATNLQERVKQSAGAGTGIPEGKLLGATSEIGKTVAGAMSTGFNNVVNFLSGNKREDGGPVDPFKTFLVGERGPELFKAKDAGDIIPTGQLKNIMGGMDPSKMAGMDPSKMFSSMGSAGFNPGQMFGNIPTSVSGVRPGETPAEAKKRIGDESLAELRRSGADLLPSEFRGAPKIPTIPSIPKVEAPKPTPAPAQAPTATPTSASKTVPTGPDASLKDLQKELQTLNKHIMQMVSHAEGTKEATLKQVKATKAMTNDRLQRG